MPNDNIDNIIVRFKSHPGPLNIIFNKTNPKVVVKICKAGLYSVKSLRKLALDSNQPDPLIIEGPLKNDENSYNVFNLSNPTLPYFTQLEYLSATRASQDAILQLPHLTSGLHLTDSGSINISTILKLSRLRDLSLHACKEIIVDGSIETNSMLTRLQMTKSFIKDPGSFLKQLVNLKALHLQYFYLEYPAYDFIVPMTTLESLKLYGWVDPESSEKISFNTNLTRLELAGGFATEDYSNDLDAWSRLTKLQILKLEYFGLPLYRNNIIPAEKCHFLTNLTLLSEFHSKAAVYPATDTIQFLQPNHLTHLTLEYDDNLIEEDGTILEGEVSIARLYNLQSLSLGWVASKVTDIGHLTQLTALTCYDLNQIDTTDIMSLTQLKNFKIDHYHSPFDWHTITTSTNLESLDINSCISISPPVTLELTIISQLTKLQRLILNDYITRRYSRWHVMSNLTSLKISEHVTLNGDDLRELTNLRELSMHHNSATELEPLTALHKMTYLYSSSTLVPEWQWYSALTQLRVLKPYSSSTRYNEWIDTDEWKNNLSHLVQLIRYFE